MRSGMIAAVLSVTAAVAARGDDKPNPGAGAAGPAAPLLKVYDIRDLVRGARTFPIDKSLVVPPTKRSRGEDYGNGQWWGGGAANQPPEPGEAIVGLLTKVVSPGT